MTLLSIYDSLKYPYDLDVVRELDGNCDHGGSYKCSIYQIHHDRGTGRTKNGTTTSWCRRVLRRAPVVEWHMEGCLAV